VNHPLVFVVQRDMSILPHEVSGLPAHILLVHFTIVVLPAAAAATVASAAWPTARRRLGVVTPLLALLALIFVPITVSAGEWLYDRVNHTPLINKHEALAHGLLPWAIGLAVVAVIEYAWFRYASPTSSPAVVTRDGAAGSGNSGSSGNSGHRSAAKPAMTASPVVTVIATVLALAVGAGCVVQVYRIGESGSRAVWQGSFSEKPLPAKAG
jgi:predicted membrane protein